MPEIQPSHVYLKAAQVRSRFGGVSDMWLHRRMRDAALPLPAPSYFGGLRFWRVADLEAWEAARDAMGHTPRPGPGPIVAYLEATAVQS
jgi:hypothetical protein